MVVEASKGSGIARNTASTFVARVSSMAVQAIGFAIVANMDGSAALNSYAVSTTVAFLGALLLDFGTSTWITRRVALGELPGPFLTARLPLVLIGCAVALGAWSIGGTDLELPLATLVMAISIGISLTARGVFWGQFEYDWEAGCSIGESVLVVLLLFLSGTGVLPRLDPIVWPALGYGIGAVARVSIVRFTHDKAFWSRRLPGWWQQTYSYGMENLLVAAGTQLDVLILAVLATSAEQEAGAVAAYALAMRVYYGAPTLVQALAAALLPRFTQDDQEHLSQAWKGTVGGAVVGFGAAVAFAVGCPLLGYPDSVVTSLRQALAILSLSFAPRCAAYVLGAYLTARGEQRIRVRGSLMAALVMIAGDFALIPLMGANGAAIAMVAADWLLFGAYFYGSRQLRRKSRRGESAVGIVEIGS
jgi:O-antigen/teichoic acid export membrane protein